MAFVILLGAVFTVTSCIGAGTLILRSLRLELHKREWQIFAFVIGAACLSSLVLGLAALHLIHRTILSAVGLFFTLAIFWPRKFAHRPSESPIPSIPRAWRWIQLLIFLCFGALYFFNAMAPEISPDGSGYHLGNVLRYWNAHGLVRIESIYAFLSQGMEMLFLLAFKFGRHSAAALVHLTFLVTLSAAIISYGRRFGFPIAGSFAALMVFVSPVVGIDGSSAYNDVALACILFVIFYLLQIWDQSRQHNLLFVVGLLGGFAYAVKYTGFVGTAYATVFVGWKLLRSRKSPLTSVLTIGLCTAVIAGPWLLRNWIYCHNPFAPFFNALFPNPCVTVSFEQEYLRLMRYYPSLSSRWEIPLQVTIYGEKLAGFLGPSFLLLPLLVFGRSRPHWKRLGVVAAAITGLTALTNNGTRFLIPCLPYVCLALGLALARIERLALAFIVAHAVLSWPTVTTLYCNPYAWRLRTIPLRAALRILPEESFLLSNSGGYAMSRAIEAMVPPGDKVLTFSPPPQAYTSRQILVGYESAANETLRDFLWTAMVRDFQPSRRVQFRFPSSNIRRFRVTQIKRSSTQWRISEIRTLLAGQEIPRSAAWRLEAYPNPWQVELAFDQNAVTRWSSSRSSFPGMYLEGDFGRATPLDCVLIQCSPDQDVDLLLEIQSADGTVTTVKSPEISDSATVPDLRKAATAELKRRGVRYLVVNDGDFGSQDFRDQASNWGIRPSARDFITLSELKYPLQSRSRPCLRRARASQRLCPSGGDGLPPIRDHVIVSGRRNCDM